MTKKKNTSAAKKLIPAAGMLAVSTMMLASSTYAWFSMNKEVSVTSMSIAAKSADPIIEISANGVNYYNNLVSSGAGSNWTLPDTTIGEGNEATPVKLRLITPTGISTAEGTTGTVSWGWASSSQHDNPEADNETTAKALTAQTTPAKTENNRAAYLGIEGEDLYVLTQKLTIRNVSPDVDANNLKISEVHINKGTNTIGNAVRVLFVAADGKYALYEPNTAEGAAANSAALVSNHQWLDPATNAPATDMSQTQTDNLPIITATLDAKGTGATAAEGSSTDVDVYVFFDGTDEDAYTDQATDLSTVTVDFTFAID